MNADLLTGRGHNVGEELLRAFAENTQLGILVTDTAGRCEYANDRCCELAGLDPEQALDRGWSAALHPEDAPGLLAEWAQRPAGRAESSSEFRFLHDDGEIRWIESFAAPRYDDEGRLLGWIDTCVDLSTKKNTDVTALQEADQFRAAFENAPIGVALTLFPGNRWFRVNPALCALVGYSEQELLQLKIEDITHPDDQAATSEHRRRLLHDSTGSIDTIEKRYIRSDGEVVWVSVKSTLLRNAAGEPLYTVAHIEDVTQRRRTQQALEDAEARFRQAFDDGPIGTALVGLDGRWLRVNRALCELTGYDETELLTKTFGDITHPDDIDNNAAETRRLLAGEIRCVNFGKRYHRADGKTVSVTVSVSLMRDEAGVPLYFVSHIEDITGRIALEEQLRQSQKMEAIGRLAGGIAHDFNNLLTGISGYGEIAVRALADPELQRPKLSNALEGIRSASDEAAVLTQQLLAFSRRQVLCPELLDLNGIVTRFVPMLTRLLGEDVKVELALAPTLGSIEADPGQLRQVLMNLAVNARDAMAAGGTLLIETKNLELEAGTTPDALSGPAVMLAVSDSGVGIDPQALPRIFEPFFTTKEVGQGTGLGLSTVIGIVEQSGGRISVHSEPGRGTTFNLYLPRLDTPAPKIQDAPELPDCATGNERILVVEDNDLIRALAEEALTELGYQVTTDANPTDALERSDAIGQIDLLVTDIVMPAMNGRELAELLIQRRPELKVLFMSGYTDDAMIARGVLEPGMTFLQKPFTIAQLADKIRHALDS